MSERNEHNDGNTQTAYFAGGCFWGLERYFQNVDGVTDTTVGYAQSTVESPAYEQVCAGGTDAAETVKVEFNPAQVSLRTLTLLFLEVIDPFSVDQQGEDRGRQYRTGMFYTDETQRAVYVAALEQLVDRQPQRPPPLGRPPRLADRGGAGPPASRSARPYWSNRCATSTRPRHIIRTIW